MAVKPSSEMADRLKKMLTRDKMGVGEGFLATLKSDEKRLLCDYFSLDGDAEVSVTPLDDGSYDIQIKAKASKIKSFDSTSELSRKNWR